MNSFIYTDLALKTAAVLATPLLNLVHAVLGLCDEAEELTRSVPGSPDELAELGDLLWFSALAGRIIAEAANIDVWSNRPTQRFVSPRQAVILSAGRAAGLVKKPFAHGQSKPVPYALLAECVSAVISAVENIANSRGWTLQRVMEANLAKLDNRYKGGGFTADSALNRDTEAELKAVEGKPSALLRAIPEFVEGSAIWDVAYTMDERDALISQFNDEHKYAGVDSTFVKGDVGAQSYWIVKALPKSE